jgi:hypothetical protein
VRLNHDTVPGMARVALEDLAGLRTHALASAGIRVFVLAVAVRLFGQADGSDIMSRRDLSAALRRAKAGHEMERPTIFKANGTFFGRFKITVFEFVAWSCSFFSWAWQQSSNEISRRPQRRRDQELSQHSPRVSSAMRHLRSLWRELRTLAQSSGNQR